jgi:hypothetical protein
MTEKTKATVIAALVHYGLSAYDGRRCVQALREVGGVEAAGVLEQALKHRVYIRPGVRHWKAEEEDADTR